MMDFQLNTYESSGSFPELTISTRVIFPKIAGLANINVDAVKNAIIENLYYQSVTLNGDHFFKEGASVESK